MNVAESDTQKQESQSVRICAHCRTPLSTRDEKFCCGGCELVFNTIHSLGLSGFYKLRAGTDGEGTEQIPTLKSYAYLSDPEISAQISKELPNKLTEVRFYLPTIHCAACVWILEKLPFVLEGVSSSRVSLATGQIELVLDQQSISLEKLASFMHSLGYPPVPATDSLISSEDKRIKRSFLMRIGVAAVCAANTMMLSDSLIESFFTGMEPEFLTLFMWASAIIALPAVIWSAAPFYRSALSTLLTGRVHIDLPISIAIIASYSTDLFTVISGRGHVYFDSITCLIFLLLLGRYAQWNALSRSRASTATTWDLFPVTARVKVGSDFVDKPLQEIHAGDVVLVRPEERIPVDGSVYAGTSMVDSSLLTGESLPQHAQAGDAVLGGTFNIDGSLEIVVQYTGVQTRLGKVLESIKTHQGNTIPIEDQANKISGYFTVSVLGLSVACFVIWYLIDPIKALPITISLLVITCPCALGLAVPASVAVALAQARKVGVYIRNPSAMSLLPEARKFYFDKTGTLTTGKLSVSDEIDSEKYLSLVRRLARASARHPVSLALDVFASSIEEAPLGSYRHVGGKGVEGYTVDGRTISLGSYRWFIERQIFIPEHIGAALDRWLSHTMTVSLLEIDKRTVCAFALSDSLHPHSQKVISALKSLRKEILILSGDAQPVVNAIGHSLGIENSVIRGDLYPWQKRDVLRGELSQTVYVGDGLNDAQAMQAAGVGIALKGGIESALEAADIYIATGDGIEGFYRTLRGAQKLKGIIYRNLTFSLLYNVIGATLAIAGYVTPLLAAILMPLSSLIVILSSALPTYFRKES